VVSVQRLLRIGVTLLSQVGQSAPCRGAVASNQSQQCPASHHQLRSGRRSVVRYFLPASLCPFAANASPKALRGPPPAGF
jgi:hypothetical protein